MTTNDKAYQSQYNKNHYLANKAYYVDKAKVQKKAMREWYESQKAGRSCPCGEDNPACLDFHHRDPSQKLDAVATMAHRGIGRKRMMEEIDKCDVLCANCHRKLHAGIA